MIQKICFTVFSLLMMIAVNAQGFEDEWFQSYENYKENRIKDRRFKHELVLELLQNLKAEEQLEIQKVGESIEGRSLNLVSLGKGDIDVFLWSQMHGDESTATMAIFDILNFFTSEGFEKEKKEMLSKLRIHFLPMLNPDGAELFRRRNALGIDINRDALRLQSPEGQTLKRIRDSLEADFGYNLHDQSRYYNAERTSKPATISFLATAYNYEKDINDVRKRSMQLIIEMDSILQKFAPGQIGRYNDDFEPRAFGDNIQKWGTSLILIESGGYQNDREKQEIRKLNFVAILSSLKSIAEGSYKSIDISEYEKIPENDRMLFDLKLKAVKYNINGKEYILDIGIDRSENDLNGHKDFYYSARVSDQGDLSTSYGYEELDASDYELKFPKIYPDVINSENELQELNVADLLQKGIGYIKVSKDLLQENYSDFPLNLVAESFQVPEELHPGVPANFILFKDDQVDYAIINGFLSSPDEASETIPNSIIFK